ncbi:MAG TPA: phosphatidate cytidylyltransferase [Burkholderiales bacterium]|nr:phosphatidate cytidylyltransferase [Burkholderiales bacterium]
MSPVGIPANAKAADGGAARSALKQRVLTALVLVPLLLASLFLLPGIGWQLLTCLPIALAAGEWARLGGFRRTFRVAFVGIVLASCLAFVAAFLNIGNWGRAGDLSHLLLVAALMFWTIAVPLWLYRGWRVTQPLLFGAVGWTVLVPAWLAAVFLQRSPWLLLATLLVVWIADTAAYFAGRRFGRRKLAPRISPGKSWEGVTGAFVAVLVYGLAASLVLQPSANIYERVVTLIFVCALTVISIVGDLFESWIKRGAGAKDSGSLLPGHGGVLDRIDSLTAALPFAALYFLPVLAPA